MAYPLCYTVGVKVVGRVASESGDWVCWDVLSLADSALMFVCVYRWIELLSFQAVGNPNHLIFVDFPIPLLLYPSDVQDQAG